MVVKRVGVFFFLSVALVSVACGGGKSLSSSDRAAFKHQLLTQGLRMTKGDPIEDADALDRIDGIVQDYRKRGLSSEEAGRSLRSLAKQITSWCDSCATELYTKANALSG